MHPDDLTAGEGIETGEQSSDRCLGSVMGQRVRRATEAQLAGRPHRGLGRQVIGRLVHPGAGQSALQLAEDRPLQAQRHKQEVEDALVRGQHLDAERLAPGRRRHHPQPGTYLIR